MTRFGPLDLLGTIGLGHDYRDLLEHSDEIEIGDLRLRLLSLEKLIEVKEEMGFEKDKATLPVLRQTLLEKQRRREQEK
jgi:predicted nucleotidyltransferase